MGSAHCVLCRVLIVVAYCVLSRLWCELFVLCCVVCDAVCCVLCDVCWLMNVVCCFGACWSLFVKFVVRCPMFVVACMVVLFAAG